MWQNLRRWLRRAKNHPARQSFRAVPLVEPLEERCVPTAGVLDPGFANAGVLRTSFLNVAGQSSTNRVIGFVPWYNGDILAVGDTNGDLAVNLYNPGGNLNRTFGPGGTAVTAFVNSKGVPLSVSAVAFALAPDGKIVVLGDALDRDSAFASDHDFALARYNPNGTLDKTFGNHGRVVTNLSTDRSGNKSQDIPTALLLLPGGKILVVGSCQNDFVLVCYNEDGTLNRSFGRHGIVITPFVNAQGRAVPAMPVSAVLQADGKIVVAGDALDSSAGATDDDFALARYNVNGKPDRTFGNRGIVLTNFSTDSTGHNSQDTVTGLVLEVGWKKGKEYFDPLVVGNSNGNFALARYTPAGRLDKTFGRGGKVATVFQDAQGMSLSTSTAAFALQTGYQIVVAGSALEADGTFASPDEDFALARYNADGRPDTSFGAAGTVLTNFSTDANGMNSTDLLGHFAFQADGKIVAAGTSNGQFALARYNTDGTLDATFGSGGKATTAASTSGLTNIAGIAFGSNGKIVVAGNSAVANPDSVNQHFVFARYLSDTVPTPAKPLTLDQLRTIMPKLPVADAQRYLAPLNNAMQEFGITTPQRQAAFLAQLAYQSKELTQWWQSKAPRVLANYLGRGPMVMYSYGSYQTAAMALDYAAGPLDIVNEPDLVADGLAHPDIGFRTAAWLWQQYHFNVRADQMTAGNLPAIVQGITATLVFGVGAQPYAKQLTAAGLEARIKFTQIALQTLSS
jgi:uncharacterized delta-60 repeat protein